MGALYRKAHMAGKPKEVSYVVARKHKAEKRSQRPSGIKGPYKQVDPRMKKDTSAKRGNVKKGKKKEIERKPSQPSSSTQTDDQILNLILLFFSSELKIIAL